MKSIHNYKKHDLPKDSFIQGWYMPEETCDGLVKHFNKNRDKAKPGASLYEGALSTDKTIKDSLDLSLGNNNFNPGIFLRTVSTFVNTLGYYQEEDMGNSISIF